MNTQPTLHLLYSCPFCWKVRGLIEAIDLDVEFKPVNGLKMKKQTAFAGDWGKVPIFTDVDGSIHVDSTPLLTYIDATHNGGKYASIGEAKRNAEWMDWVDKHMSKATVPILYGSLFSALHTTRRVSKLERFGFISKRLYAWAGFPIMWGIIAKKRVKKDGRTPQKLWHDLLDEFIEAFDDQPFFGGETPNLVDFSAFGYMRSISPFNQFNFLESHQAGLTWYHKMVEHIA